MQRKYSMKIVLKNYNDRIIFKIIKDLEVEYIFKRSVLDLFNDSESVNVIHAVYFR